MATGRHFSVAAGRLVAIWLGVLMLAVDHSAATVASSDQLSVPPELRCPDGRIPLNSPQSRCRSQPQLQWTGRQCQNSSLDFSCPSGFDCLAGGICCESPEAPRADPDLVFNKTYRALVTSITPTGVYVKLHGEKEFIPNQMLSPDASKGITASDLQITYGSMIKITYLGNDPAEGYRIFHRRG